MSIIIKIIKYTIHNITKFAADVFADDMCRSHRRLKRYRESQEERNTTATTWKKHLIQSVWLHFSKLEKKMQAIFNKNTVEYTTQQTVLHNRRTEHHYKNYSK